MRKPAKDGLDLLPLQNQNAVVCGHFKQRDLFKPRLAGDTRNVVNVAYAPVWVVRPQTRIKNSVTLAG
ncbi:MAG: hypothetical protein ACI8YI_002875, partial [Paracoccaceae bacterium]